MALTQDIEMLLEAHKGQKNRIAHDETLFRIFEGELLDYVKKALKEQLSEKSYEQACHRIAPINVLKRLTDKLSKIYAKAPVRNFDGKPAAKDEEILKFYTEEMDPNTAMALANELFNLHKRVFVEPFLDQGKPRLRVLPASRFGVVSVDPVNPLRPTHFYKIMGTYKDADGLRTLFFAYTDEEFIAYNDKGEILPRYLEGNNGRNIYGRVPGVYINRSKHELVPPMDSDTLAMTLLIPVILTDVNYAHMFCSFPILYGVDVEDHGLIRAPNAFWHLKSDPTNAKTPQVGSLNPSLDTQKSIDLLKAQLAFWMQSRGIKPGAMGDLTVENAASGIAKAIDEMDTAEDRQKQVPIFKDAEESLWDLLINSMHPVWMRDPEFKFRAVAFTKGVGVKVQFAEQRPIVDSTKAIGDQKLKIELGLQDRFGAMKELYPDWTDDQINEWLSRVDKSKEEQTKKAQEMLAESPDSEGEDESVEEEGEAAEAQQAG